MPKVPYVSKVASIGARSKSQVTKVALCALVKSPLVEGTNFKDQLVSRRDPNIDQLVDHHCSDQCAIICDDNTTY